MIEIFREDIRILGLVVCWLGKVAGWLMQMLIAPLPSLVLSILVTVVADLLAPEFRQIHEHLQPFILLSGWTLSFFLAIAVSHVFPRANATGRWIWVLPVALLVAGFCWDAGWISLRFALVEFFTTGPHKAVFILFTCPTVSAIAYSLGMVFAARRARMRPQL